MKRCVCEHCNSDLTEIGCTTIYPHKTIIKLVPDGGELKPIRIEDESISELLIHDVIKHYCNNCFQELDSKKLILLFTK